MVAQVAASLVSLVPGSLEVLGVWWTCLRWWLLFLWVSAVDGYDWMLVDNRRLQFLTALGGYYSLEVIWQTIYEKNLICSVESSVLRTTAK